MVRRDTPNGAELFPHSSCFEMRETDDSRRNLSASIPLAACCTHTRDSRERGNGVAQIDLVID
jgi:hypothetical protein